MARYSLNDSRRLTGANLYWQRPSAIVDVDIEGDDPATAEALVRAWTNSAKNLLRGVGHEDEQLTQRLYAGGASLLISAPIDALYSMCELNEAAFAQACWALESGPPVGVPQEIARLKKLFAQEAYPPVLAMQKAAAAHGVPFLWDDDDVSVGYGRTAVVWPSKEVPSPDSVDWPSIRTIPVGLVTGTNGKSTSVRMAASIIRAAGLSAGLTSTDWIRVGGQILDTGDYSGPGGVRTLMRHPETEIAVLEVARGGLLRRGLGVEDAAAALVTNVASDHLGEYGINTVEELAEAKFIVRKALKGRAPLVLNAGDARSVAQAGRLEGAFADNATEKLIWIGLDPQNPVIAKHLAAGGRAFVYNQPWLEFRQGDAARPIVKAADIPATMGGAARHNICNALGAMALCHAMGIEDTHLRQGLEAFQGDENDNPGRGNWFEHNGVRILVDFAHNEHGMTALADMVAAVPAERRVLLMGQAGDRSNDDIRDLTVAACRLSPDRLLVTEVPGYERGRAPGEVPGLIAASAMAAGVGREAISTFNAPVEAVKEALENAQPGDLLVLLALTQRGEVLELIHRFTGND